MSEDKDKTTTAPKTPKGPSRAEKAADLKASRAQLRLKRADVQDTQTISVVAEKNPRRLGTVPHAHFEKYTDGQTVGEFLSKENGGEWIHMQADIERGHIKLAA